MKNGEGNNNPSGGGPESDNPAQPRHNQIQQVKEVKTAPPETGGGEQSAYSEEEEELIKKRLEDLGYL